MTFQAGDKVTVWHDGTITGIRTVTRVMRRFVELKDGSQWRLNGDGRYPRSKWDRDRIALTTQEDREHIECRRLRRVILDALDTASLETLRRMGELAAGGLR